MLFDKGLKHFLDFHKGYVNIVLHIIGFAGLFYSIYKVNWILFLFFVIILESGHIYNHISGIKRYDMRLHVIFTRAIVFLILVLVLYFISKT